MKELYQRLYSDTNTEYKHCKKCVGLSDLSHFVAMKGRKYDQDHVRLFVIGRAVNGWETLPCESGETFSKAAEQEFNAVGFTWIANNGESFYSLHNIPEDGEPTYYLSKSPFWRTTEKIWRGLSGSDDFRFVDHIAWSNLYKIAPKQTGNPSTTMCKKQFAACRDILDAEIRAYKPTHILFITGYEWWYADPICDFSTLFENNKRLNSNKPDRTIFVEGTAEYRNNNMIIPVVISCRPERKDEKAFAAEVLDAFRR